jgi:hypothetical protein
LAAWTAIIGTTGLATRFILRSILVFLFLFRLLGHDSRDVGNLNFGKVRDYAAHDRDVNLRSGWHSWRRWNRWNRWNGRNGRKFGLHILAFAQARMGECVAREIKGDEENLAEAHVQ